MENELLLKKILSQRQWPERSLNSYQHNFLKPNCCAGCGRKLKKWAGVFYGVCSDYQNLYDCEYSERTGWCEKCAQEEAERTRKKYKTFDPPVVVKKILFLDSSQQPLLRRIYSDGSVVTDCPDLDKKNKD
jgi:hypothetical protein